MSEHARYCEERALDLKRKNV